jgi:hypothetical protein
MGGSASAKYPLPVLRLHGRLSGKPLWLSASEALAKLLPATVLASPPPSSSRADPRQVMWEIYLKMRRNGEIPPEGVLKLRWRGPTPPLRVTLG